MNVLKASHTRSNQIGPFDKKDNGYNVTGYNTVWPTLTVVHNTNIITSANPKVIECSVTLYIT